MLQKGGVFLIYAIFMIIFLPRCRLAKICIFCLDRRPFLCRGSPKLSLTAVTKKDDERRERGEQEI